MMERGAKIYVAGHRGLVGSALVRKLEDKGYGNLVVRTSMELDLRRQEKVERFFDEEKPEYVFLAAAKVGGIWANSTNPGPFIYDNLAIQLNVLECARIYGVKKLLFLGSSCIYPRDCPQPIREEYLLTGPLEPTNEPYAVAKIAGIKMCQAYRKQYGCNFIAVMPANLYGPNDNYDLDTSHVLPAIIRKFREAKERKEPFVTLWGTGIPRREFLHVDDLADACLFLMNNYEGNEIINIGTGSDLQIRDLAEMIKKAVGYEGKIHWDKAKPDGTPRKLLDTTRIAKMGWKNQISLLDGLIELIRGLSGQDDCR
jgi:GDP-L-fucose synthase